MDRLWVAFFSQTGTEILSLVDSVGHLPDIIVTNERPEHIRTVNVGIKNAHLFGKTTFMVLPNKPTVEDYEEVLEDLDNPLITLHGWLRIMPPEICEKYEIYNGHPGLITKYPELKGKDPQVKAWEGNYEWIGSVIHKVTAGVDEGEVLGESSIRVEGLDLDQTFTILSKLSHGLWSAFLEKHLGT